MSEYVRVPRAPTVEMIAATVDAVFGGAIEDASIIAEVYSAMVEAATAGQEPTDADRDYADMRRMQAALIAKTHECNELRALAAEQPQPDYPCRSDGRCQYAIDSGAEGMGHCPRGKCVMPAEQPQSEAEFDGLEWARKFAEFDPPAPAEQPQPVGGWRLVPVEPTAEHIDSIAMRYSHDFGLLPENQQENLRAFARQMYEECSGQGFYRIAPPPPAAAPTVTDAMVEAACKAYLDTIDTFRGSMRAAIDAALAAKGVR